MVSAASHQDEYQAIQSYWGSKSCPASSLAAIVHYVPSAPFLLRQSGTRGLLLTLGLLFCQPLAFAGSKKVPLNALLKRQIETTATALHTSDIHPFQNGQIKNEALVDFGVTIAMFDHYRSIFLTGRGGMSTSKGLVPTKYVEAEVEKYFGRTVSNVSTKRYHYKNGSYAVAASDPENAPGGYKLSKLIQTGGTTYTASVSLYAPDINDRMYVYATERLDLRKLANGAKSRFIVVGYGLQDREASH